MFENKLEKIKNDGFENLQFVLDFDRTITGPVNMEPAPPMISFLRESDILGEEYKEKAQANFLHYFPLEKSHELSHQEKSALMHEWWEKHLTQLVEFGLTKEKIFKIANSQNLVLRDGVKELFEFSNKNNVPIIIFSAGILGSESIKFFLEKNSLNISNTKIFTNELTFDQDGKVIGFKEPIIHSENKDEEILILEAKLNNWTLRKNTILAGDGFGDVKMVLDKRDCTVLRIGISDKLRNKEEVELYKKYFDCVTDNFFEIINYLK